MTTFATPVEAPAKDLPPVLEDMSLQIFPGTVPTDYNLLDVLRTEIECADQIGLRGIWMCERYSNKVAPIVLGATAALSDRLEIATGPIPCGSRPVLVAAGIGSTMAQFSGNRAILGIGRSISSWIQGWGFHEFSYRATCDYANVIRGIWRGDRTPYEGPASPGGRIDTAVHVGGPLREPLPPIVLCCIGGPKASRTAASSRMDDGTWTFDGISYAETLTVEAVRRSVTWIREECERVGRDPSTLRIYAGITTALDVDEDRLWEMVGARLAMIFQSPDWGQMHCERNGWDRDLWRPSREHPRLTEHRDRWADHVISREDFAEIAKETIPYEILGECAAIGTSEEGARTLQKFKDVGVDEITLYGQHPTEVVDFCDIWRNRPEANASS